MTTTGPQTCPETPRSASLLLLSVAVSTAGCFTPQGGALGGSEANAGADSSADSGVDGTAGGLVTTCDTFANVPVGAYVVETDYWNATSCPGTECIAVNTDGGSFTVTEAPSCGGNVASFPNVLYGSSFGEVSPGSVLPMQVSALQSVTSSWDFSVGGVSTDSYDVAYDIWFCPDNTCGDTQSFNGGTELMIWLNYQNAVASNDDAGSADLDGHSWGVWTYTEAEGAAWTYVAYLIQPSVVTSVNNLNLLPFFQDLEARGLIHDSWYLYAIQAGDEIRSGGMPFSVNSFSVSIQ